MREPTRGSVGNVRRKAKAKASHGIVWGVSRQEPKHEVVFADIDKSRFRPSSNPGSPLMDAKSNLNHGSCANDTRRGWTASQITHAMGVDG